MASRDPSGRLSDKDMAARKKRKSPPKKKKAPPKKKRKPNKSQLPKLSPRKSRVPGGMRVTPRVQRGSDASVAKRLRGKPTRP